jgi:transposase
MANRKIDMSEYKNAVRRLRAGESDRQIARETKLGRHKIKELRLAAQAKGWLNDISIIPCDEEISELLKTSGNPRQTSTVSPYHAEIKDWLEKGATAQRIHEKLQEECGFSGHYNAVQRYIKKYKDADVGMTSPMHFSVGEAAQVDFGKGPDLLDERTGTVRATWFFVMTLCWSRHQYVELVTNQDIESWLRCHQNAFEWFGGVVNKVIIDNPKCAITKACYYEPTVQKSYEELAEEYGFIISACPVRDPQKKGRVENGVKYVKQNFLSLREFKSLQHANQQLRKWIIEKAGDRLHGSTKKRPLEQFHQVEQPELKPLPTKPYEISVWHKVKLYRDCHIRFKKAKYSAPSHLGPTLRAVR